jgi:hypothetical protein
MFRSAATLAPLATQSHLKIQGISPDGQLLGFGAEGLARLLGIYRDAGYRGALAFEHVGPGDALTELPIAKRIVDQAISLALSTASSPLAPTTAKAHA